ncbi:carboxylesterase family protein [Sediminicola luteus]|uniref:Alpha/beta hydrolase n=1 Tax=Sediminicola luteus TaxID=319238 RepID=A0A2A4GE59_9FLAO|nr:alpha/beta hydrolase [Sediminicola luteus]PCE66288.1 alpha/beta hydrolase [Sediminicola luteus]
MQTRIALSFLLVFLFQFSPAQKRQGNIVEYFGKEKVNEIKEGKPYHVFSKGLYLSGQRSALNSMTFPTDPVFKDFLMSDKKVTQGETGFIDTEGNPQSWQSISTDDKSTFNDRKLRGAYVYLTYTSKTEKTVLFEASGHTNGIINGYPHEGDYYDFGYSLIPITLKKGVNTFVLKVGRFPRIRARLIAPKSPVLFTQRDMTLPDLLWDTDLKYKGAIRIVNSSKDWVESYDLTSTLQGKQLTILVPAIAPMSSLKVPFGIAALAEGTEKGKIQVQLSLRKPGVGVVDETEISLHIKSRHQKHKRTFISDIDGSVQYFAVAPSSNHDLEKGALFLSVHGASVEATNQANAYKQKDWGTVVAPTNRRPFGFAWEDWGRLDALEVLAEGKRIYAPDPQKIYLTGHSMGGHGSWYLGATYPDKFAAIAPCAGYPDLLGYRDSFVKRALRASKEELKQWGITQKQLERMQQKPQLTAMDHMIQRAGNPSRTLKLKRNYLQQGVYILHGEKDNVVPTFIAREMRENLGTFHNDFTYYEYPGGTHWYGDHSMDWPPIFEMFKRREIKTDSTINTMEFYTASPGVSAQSHFTTIYQQEKPLEISSIDFSREKNRITTANVALLKLDTQHLKLETDHIEIDSTHVMIDSDVLYLTQTNGSWEKTATPNPALKGPHRNGGFKDAFKNQMVFVYATNGTPTENQWYFNKARLDAETFYYRANGRVVLVPDSDFSPKAYADRNIILYGNADNNKAWKKLLKNAEVQVINGKATIGGRETLGNQWGLYFVLPRPDSDTASVGVISATGTEGMKAIYSNHYLINGTTYPDLMLFSNDIMQFGTDAVKCAGFFGNDWSYEQGDWQWK